MRRISNHLHFQSDTLNPFTTPLWGSHTLVSFLKNVYFLPPWTRELCKTAPHKSEKCQFHTKYLNQPEIICTGQTQDAEQFVWMNICPCLRMQTNDNVTDIEHLWLRMRTLEISVKNFNSFLYRLSKSQGSGEATGYLSVLSVRKGDSGNYTYYNYFNLVIINNCNW